MVSIGFEHRIKSGRLVSRRGHVVVVILIRAGSERRSIRVNASKQIGQVRWRIQERHRADHYRYAKVGLGEDFARKDQIVLEVDEIAVDIGENLEIGHFDGEVVESLDLVGAHRAKLFDDELFFDFLFVTTGCELGDLNELELQVLKISASLIRYGRIDSYQLARNKGSLVQTNYDLVRLFEENKEASCQISVGCEWTIESVCIQSIQVQRRLDSEDFDDFFVHKVFCINFEPDRIADEIELEVELVVISVKTAWQVVWQLVGERIGIVSSMQIRISVDHVFANQDDLLVDVVLRICAIIAQADTSEALKSNGHTFELL